MSKLSFKSFCIEFYARHIGSTGVEVYRMFSESGLLKTLDDDYEDLHGLGWEALMPMFDEYLGRAVPKDHTLIRATLVPAIVTFLAAHYHVTENDAMGMFYSSKTAEAFADDDLGLYGQSALNLAGDVIQERNKQ